MVCSFLFAESASIGEVREQFAKDLALPKVDMQLTLQSSQLLDPMDDEPAIRQLVVDGIG